MSTTSWIRRWMPRKSLDTYTLRRRGWQNGIIQAIQLRRDSDRMLFVTHFQDTFSELAALLDAHRIDFRIEDQMLWGHTVHQSFAREPVVLTMSAMLHPSQTSGSSPAPGTLRVIALERHPLWRHDQQISRFIDTVAGLANLSYFMSLEDPLIRRWIHPTTIEILKQFGLNENELISSLMVSRTLNRRQKQLDRSIKSEVAAGTVDQWFQANQTG